MADDDMDEDVPLLNDDADDPLITLDSRQPHVEAVFVVTFDVKFGKTKIHLAISLSISRAFQVT